MIYIDVVEDWAAMRREPRFASIISFTLRPQLQDY
jgi:hypothetical protein